MYVILVYDIHQKTRWESLENMPEIFDSYTKSVFEGNITESKLKR